jgi:SAM-dependent methyltransferase
VFEVGCGTGVYPIKLKELFSNIKYTGIDISETAIKQCKKNSSFEFLVGDFIKLNISKKFDLVYSHAVVDHVYDMDAFVAKIVDVTKKYAYITAYRGFFPVLKKHRMNWNNEDGSYYNDFSIIQIKKKFKEIGLNENEFNIRSLKVDNKNDNLDYQTIIEIEKQ